MRKSPLLLLGICPLAIAHTPAEAIDGGFSHTLLSPHHLPGALVVCALLMVFLLRRVLARQRG